MNSYGRKIEGTGSLLAIQSSESTTTADDSKEIQIDKKSIRFFSPKEIANLHCFPKDFGKKNLK